MDPSTNKELLSLILANQKKQDKNILNISLELSNHINKQTPLNDKLIGYLESNEKTNQKGGIERIGDLETRTDTLESTLKVTFGKASVLGFVFLFLGSAMFKILNLIF